MSVIEGIHQTLAQDTALVNMLATDHEGNPAIFTTWGLRDRERPYIVIRLQFRPTEDDTVRTVSVDTDIFTKGESSLVAEAIRDRVIALLHRKTIAATEAGDGGIRIMLNTDGEIPEDTTGVIHWNVSFQGRFGAQRVIENLLA